MFNFQVFETLTSLLLKLSTKLEPVLTLGSTILITYFPVLSVNFN
jgi:hypothetical protein